MRSLMAWGRPAIAVFLVASFVSVDSKVWRFTQQTGETDAKETQLHDHTYESDHQERFVRDAYHHMKKPLQETASDILGAIIDHTRKNWALHYGRQLEALKTKADKEVDDIRTLNGKLRKVAEREAEKGRDGPGEDAEEKKSERAHIAELAGSSTSADSVTMDAELQQFIEHINHGEPGAAKALVDVITTSQVAATRAFATKLLAATSALDAAFLSAAIKVAAIGRRAKGDESVVGSVMLAFSPSDSTLKKMQKEFSHDVETGTHGTMSHETRQLIAHTIRLVEHVTAVEFAAILQETKLKVDHILDKCETDATAVCDEAEIDIDIDAPKGPSAAPNAPAPASARVGASSATSMLHASATAVAEHAATDTCRHVAGKLSAAAGQCRRRVAANMAAAFNVVEARAEAHNAAPSLAATPILAAAALVLLAWCC